MTSIAEVKSRFSPATIDYDKTYEWLMSTNSETSFASLACKLKSYHDLVTNSISKQPKHKIHDKTLDLFYTLFYTVYNCTSDSDVEKFNIHMDIISHFFTTYKDDNINKASILREDLSDDLTSKRYGTWLALLELLDQFADKNGRGAKVPNFDFETLLDRDDIYMHDFGINALISYFKNN